MNYEFKVIQEIAWAFAVGAGAVGFEILIKLDPETVTDWRTWAIASGVAVLRAGLAAALPVLLRAGKKLLSKAV